MPTSGLDLHDSDGGYSEDTQIRTLAWAVTCPAATRPIDHALRSAQRHRGVYTSLCIRLAGTPPLGAALPCSHFRSSRR